MVSKKVSKEPKVLRASPSLVKALAFAGRKSASADWRSEDKKTETKKSSKEPRTMEELLTTTGYQLRGLKRGDTLEGKIVSLKPQEILIDIGYKSLGVVSEKELGQVKDIFPNLKVGDRISAQIVSPETEGGQIILSVRRAGIERIWQELVDKKEKEEEDEVTGVEVTRGGLLVDYQGLRGFIPSSQLNPGRDPREALGKNLKVVVLEAERAINRLVFSEKKASYAQKLAEKVKELAKIKIREVYEGNVSGIVPFGIFVSINKLEGLVHISEIAWEKVTNPSDYFKIGDKVRVLVTSLDPQTGKLNFSIKQLTSDPWQEVVKKYSPESKISSRVSRTSGFGIFVELEKGIEGLIHISKIPPGLELKVGEKVDCLIEDIDFKKRKISLALILKEKPVGYR